jgi:LL-diaminopimelate aminotransferase
MTGWRLGFVAGGAKAVKAFSTVKDNIDSGQFKAIQVAACAGIADRALADSIRDHYARRLRGMVRVLRAAGFDAAMPGGTFFLYAKAPTSGGGGRFESAEQATDYLIREHSIATVPWDDAGAFLRFSATFESTGDADDDRVLAELGRRLAKAGLGF